MPHAQVDGEDLPLLNTIRHQLNSKLDNQKHAARTLKAVEDTIMSSEEYDGKLHPVAYFGVLVSHDD